MAYTSGGSAISTTASDPNGIEGVLCIAKRSDGYVWGTQQIREKDNRIFPRLSFSGGMQLYVQDCSTGAVTNARNSITFPAKAPDRGTRSGGKVRFTSVGTKIGNSVNSHSYRLVVRYITGTAWADVDYAGGSRVFFDRADGTSFGDVATRCWT